MRKLVLAAVTVAVLAVAGVASAGSATFGGLPIVNVIVNGKALSTPGVVVEGKTMAPVRAVAESLGGTVSWDSATYTATIVAPDVTQLQTENAQLESENAQLKTEVADLKAKLQPGAPQPGEPGHSRTAPAGLGTTLTISYKDLFDEYTAKVTLLEVVRGDAAWQKIQAANMFNDPPAAGTEYIAARIKYELVSIPNGKTMDLSPVDFTAVSGAGKEYDHPMVVPPAPDLRTSLYAGASTEGWVVFQVAKDDTAPVVAYGRSYDGTGGLWFRLTPGK